MTASDRGVTASDSPAEPLAGFRILDLTTFLSGPLATRSLATLGADVVKVEPPSGDPTRAGTGLKPGDPPSPFWLALHRDRRSIVLDLKSDSGRSMLLELVEKADALVENFRPGVMGRLGLGKDTLTARNPRLVTCSLTGFGADGPFSQIAAIDGPVQAFTGALELTGEGGQPGFPIPMQIADIAGASYTTQAVLAALLRRERTGVGGHVELSLAECVMQWLGVIDRTGTLAAPATMLLEAADGRQILVQPIMHFHPRFADLVAAVPGCESFRDDDRFRDRVGRTSNRPEYEEIVRRAFRARTSEEWLADLHAAGVPAAPIQSTGEALTHPQLVHRGAAIDVTTEPVDATAVLAPPFVFDGVRRTATTMPPALGEHQGAVLRSWLDYDDDRITEAATAGAFGPTMERATDG